jgi:hypothetical protein
MAKDSQNKCPLRHQRAYSGPEIFLAVAADDDAIGASTGQVGGQGFGR